MKVSQLAAWELFCMKMTLQSLCSKEFVGHRYATLSL
uniref:Uncharacterized protein n=1 Tax=Arundo donax TaxID=35708 RepID=A0A0A8Z003_ARUDO